MIKLFAFLTLIILTSCNNKPESKLTNIKAEEKKSSPFNRDKLDKYFEEYEIKPSITINNIESNKTEVELLKHRIKWFNSDAETKIKIDNDFFTLRYKATLNKVHYNTVDSVDFANSWDEIKLYNLNGRANRNKNDFLPLHRLRL
jgi:hypothetical protein